MAKGNGSRNWQRAITVMSGAVVTALIIASLYWVAPIFIPLAMAIYLAFLLTPLVAFLQHHGVRRIPAVLGVMLLTVAVLGGMVYLVTSQVTGLAGRLPQYNQNIHAKVEVVTTRLERINEAINRMLSPRTSSEGEGETQQAPPPGKTGISEWAMHLLGMLAPVAQGLAEGVLALVLTAFLLLDREDLRNRLIRLAGRGHVTLATRVLDDAGQRISRFLIMQALINAIAGALMGLGLLAIGVEYALLWGFLVFILRYVPYVGIWIAALPPVLLGFAMFEGWTQPVMVIGVIMSVELFCAYVLEPWWFGHSMGVSAFALLVMAAFCAFFWGPVGMVLSSPITVCLVVLGKYDPRLKFLDVLLGDEPALGPTLRFYQRLLARDQDEAAEVVVEELKEQSAEKVLDELLVPALVYAKRDRMRDDLPEDDEEFILQAVREIGEELVERLEVAAGPARVLHEQHSPSASRIQEVHVLACPAQDDEDELALHLLAETLDPNRWKAEVLSTDTLGSELVSCANEKQPDLILIGALSPGGLAHTRYLCKRLRMRFPRVKIIVARWGMEPSADEKIDQLHQAGADFVTTNLSETRAQMHAWYPVLVEGETEPVAEQREREIPAVQHV